MRRPQGKGPYRSQIPVCVRVFLLSGSVHRSVGGTSDIETASASHEPRADTLETSNMSVNYSSHTKKLLIKTSSQLFSCNFYHEL